ncbi:MAG: tetratricopeptide repeat protein, partial [Chlorobi bacterium]|nr:tetratricopeptide repeat protein [Chlorobiota bacterium]
MVRTISFQTLIIAVLLIGMGTMGFQCSSPNITSARMYYQQKKYDKAEEVLNKEIKQNPNNAEAWYWLGIIQGTKKEFLKLVESWNRSLKISNQMKSKIDENRPYFWGLAFNYGAKNLKKARITKREKEYEKAIEGFKAAIKLLPDSSAKYGAYLNLGLVYLNQGKQDKAIEPFMKSVEIEKLEQSYEILGQLYLAQGTDLQKQGKKEEANAAFEKAIDIFNQGISKYPNSDNLRINLIQAYVKADRTKEAIAQYEKEIKVHPEDKIAQYNLGVLYMQAENY